MPLPPRRQLSRLALPLAVVVVAAVLPVQRAAGQNVLDARTAAMLRDDYMTDLDTVHEKIMALATAIPEEK